MRCRTTVCATAATAEPSLGLGSLIWEYLTNINHSLHFTEISIALGGCFFLLEFNYIGGSFEIDTAHKIMLNQSIHFSRILLTFATPKGCSAL